MADAIYAKKKKLHLSKNLSNNRNEFIFKCRHTQICAYSYVHIHVSKVGDLIWGWPEGSLFNSYHTKV